MQASAEYQSFRDHFADLFAGIQNPIMLSVRLFSAGVLSHETRKKISELTLTDGNTPRCHRNHDQFGFSELLQICG